MSRLGERNAEPAMLPRVGCGGAGRERVSRLKKGLAADVKSSFARLCGDGDPYEDRLGGILYA